MVALRNPSCEEGPKVLDTHSGIVSVLKKVQFCRRRQVKCGRGNKETEGSSDLLNIASSSEAQNQMQVPQHPNADLALALLRISFWLLPL